MKVRLAHLVLLLVLATLGTARAAEEGPPAGPTEDMIRRWQAVAQPGPEHSHLDYFVGEWKTTTRLTAPQAEGARTIEGRARARWILGGRYLLQEVNGGLDGRPAGADQATPPLRGVGLLGYDSYKKLYVSTWADNAGTGLFNLTGTRDDSGDDFILFGTVDDPILGLQDRQVKQVYRILGPDRYVVEVFDLSGEREAQVLEVLFERLPASGKTSE